MANKLPSDDVKVLVEKAKPLKNVGNAETFNEVYRASKSFANAFEKIGAKNKFGSTTMDVALDGTLTPIENKEKPKAEKKAKPAKAKPVKKEKPKKESKKKASPKPKNKKASSSKKKSSSEKENSDAQDSNPEEVEETPAEEEPETS